MTDSRRQANRLRCNFSFRGAGASTALSGRITDLSSVGLFIATPQFVPLGKQVHLEFTLPTGPVEAVGEVRWIARGANIAEPGFGLRFLRLSANSARAIDLHVDTLPK